ncbi:MAG: DUF2442 domain-containing protein [Gemmatimonadetes bacterium]|nr:DUF2442 domain-containing protein [Gemmatimonadota bacterium]
MAAESDRVVHVTFNEETLVLRLGDGCMLTVPLAWYPRLLDAPRSVRGNWKVVGSKGDAVLWPDLNEELNVARLLKLRGPHAPGGNESFGPDGNATQAR